MSVHNMTSPRQSMDIPVRNAGAALCRAIPLARSWGQVRAVADVARRWWFRHPNSLHRALSERDGLQSWNDGHLIEPFTRGTPRGLLGSIGLMAAHSWSDQADPIYEYTASHYFGRFLSGAGFPNQFFNDSWVVGLWRGRPCGKPH